MVEIRPAQNRDARELAILGETSFRETFARDNSATDMDLYCAQTFGEVKQAREIADPQRRVMLAMTEGKLIGYYQLLAGKPDPAVTGPKPIEVLRLYLDARWHGKGVAQQLMQTAIDHSKAEGFGTIWLGVWEKNLRAQAFYRKWNFREVGEHTFHLGNDPQRDLIFVRPL